MQLLLESVLKEEGSRNEWSPATFEKLTLSVSASAVNVGAKLLSH